MTKNAKLSLYVEAVSTNDDQTSPAWAHLDVNRELIDRIKEMDRACQEHNLAEAVTYFDVHEWDLQDELRLSEDRLVVAGPDFWFQTYPKYGDLVETRAISIEHLSSIFSLYEQACSSISPNDSVASVDLAEVVKAAKLDGDWLAQNGRLFYACGMQVESIAEMVAEHEDDVIEQDQPQG